MQFRARPWDDDAALRRARDEDLEDDEEDEDEDLDDDDDDDDDDSSVSAELPLRFQAAPCRCVAAIYSPDLTPSSDVTSRAESLRAPPASSL
jgi:hypothetical protein